MGEELKNTSNNNNNSNNSNNEENDNIIIDEDVILEENVQKLMERHKQYKKQLILDKDLTGNKVLLQKYDTCRALALKLRSKITDERIKNKSSPTRLGNNTNTYSNTELNVNQEIPETTIISSPKRGKIRPRSAPTTRMRRNNNNSKSSNHILMETSNNKGNYEFSPPSSPIQNNHNSKTRLGFSSQDQPVPANTLNHDEWWFLDHKNKQKIKSKNKLINMEGEDIATTTAAFKTGKLKTTKSKNNQTNKTMTDNELKEHLKKTRENKQKRTPPSTYLAEYKEREERHLRDIAITVMEEAYLMESRAYGCVEEANAYAKALGIRKKFSIFTRTVDENNHIRHLTKSSSEYLLPTQKLQRTTTTATLPVATNTQLLYENYDLMKEAGKRIEKMMIEVMTIPGEPTQLIPLDKFYAEHNKLQMELRKKRNLMTKSEKMKNYEIENNEISKEVSGMNKRRGIKDTGTEHDKKNNTTEFNGINLEDLQKLNKKDNKLKKEMKNLSKQITEEKLVKILEETKNVTAVLENQLKELKLRGWNENIK